MRTRMLTRAVTTAAAIGALTLATAAPGQARPHHQRDTLEVDVAIAQFYDNVVTGDGPDYIVFSGASAADWCAAGPEGDPGGAPATLRVTTWGTLPEPGSSDRYRLKARVPVEVYAFDEGDIFQFLDASCGDLPEPYAAGMGTARWRGTTQYDGDTAARQDYNSVRAWLRTGDGTRVRVTASSVSTIAITDPFTEDEAGEQTPTDVRVKVKVVGRGRC
ncbi:hypothetical protein [Demequina maris]|uniref:hypothetical protein n=1 Tax=Demequina maris TaxID=1638982 RepID=UPI000AEDB07D|nr:hypothetical protein [Demequina maris]